MNPVLKEEYDLLIAIRDNPGRNSIASGIIDKASIDHLHSKGYIRYTDDLFERVEIDGKEILAINMPYVLTKQGQIAVSTYDLFKQERNNEIKRKEAKNETKQKIKRKDNRFSKTIAIISIIVTIVIALFQAVFSQWGTSLLNFVSGNPVDGTMTPF